MRKVSFIIIYRYLLILMAAGLFTSYLSTGFSQTLAEASETKHSAETDITNSQASVFYSVTLEPAKVAKGDEVVVKAVFSISKDGLGDMLPVKYFYEIQKEDAIFFKSPAKKIKVVNGAKSVLEIKAEAPGGYGDYKFVLKLIHPDGTDRADMDFSIVSPDEAHAYAYRAGLLQGAPTTSRRFIDDRLAGKWRFVTPNPNAPSPELTIKKENGKLVAKVSRKDTRTHWVKLRKNEKTLVLRSKSEDLTGDCWYIVEDVITFNAGMDNMSVQTRILEGNQCVSVGKVSESRLCRIH